MCATCGLILAGAFPCLIKGINMQSKLNNSLLSISALSAQLRVMQQLGMRPSHDDDFAWQQRTHPYIQLNDAILLMMGNLGLFCQKHCLDARKSSLWPLLEFQGRYMEKYENKRKVELAELTPSAIYQGLFRGNSLMWKGWIIFSDDACEATGDYGEPILVKEICVSGPTGIVKKFRRNSKEVSQEIFRNIAGFCFNEKVVLDEDLLHSAEFCSSHNG